MGLMDKVKQQANQIAEKAQEAGKAGQAKLEAIQAKRRIDGVLSDLGAITYRARTNQAGPGDEERTDGLIAQVKAYEVEYGPVASMPSADMDGGNGSH